MEKKRKATMVRLAEEDLRALLAIRMQTGIRSDSQAIVSAIHFTARHLEQKGEGKGSSHIRNTPERCYWQWRGLCQPGQACTDNENHVKLLP